MSLRSCACQSRSREQGIVQTSPATGANWKFLRFRFIKGNKCSDRQQYTRKVANDSSAAACGKISKNLSQTIKTCAKTQAKHETGVISQLLHNIRANTPYLNSQCRAVKMPGHLTHRQRQPHFLPFRVAAPVDCTTDVHRKASFARTQ